MIAAGSQRDMVTAQSVRQAAREHRGRERAAIEEAACLLCVEGATFGAACCAQNIAHKMMRAAGLNVTGTRCKLG